MKRGRRGGGDRKKNRRLTACNELNQHILSISHGQGGGWDAPLEQIPASFVNDAQYWRAFRPHVLREAEASIRNELDRPSGGGSLGVDLAVVDEDGEAFDPTERSDSGSKSRRLARRCGRVRRHSVMVNVRPTQRHTNQQEWAKMTFGMSRVFALTARRGYKVGDWHVVCMRVNTWQKGARNELAKGSADSNGGMILEGKVVDADLERLAAEGRGAGAGGYFLREIGDVTTFLRMTMALHEMPNVPFIQQILGARASQHIKFDSDDDDDDDDDDDGGGGGDDDDGNGAGSGGDTNGTRVNDGDVNEDSGSDEGNDDDGNTERGGDEGAGGGTKKLTAMDIINAWQEEEDENEEGVEDDEDAKKDVEMEAAMEATKRDLADMRAGKGGKEVETVQEQEKEDEENGEETEEDEEEDDECKGVDEQQQAVGPDDVESDGELHEHDDASPDSTRDCTRDSSSSEALPGSSLNESQRSAIDHFLTAEGKLQLLQGPPGTGKTATIVQLLGMLATTTLTGSSDDYDRARTLVSAPSNKAVSGILEKFLRTDAGAAAKVAVIGVEDKLFSTPRSHQPVFPDRGGGRGGGQGGGDAAGRRGNDASRAAASTTTATNTTYTTSRDRFVHDMPHRMLDRVQRALRGLREQNGLPRPAAAAHAVVDFVAGVDGAAGSGSVGSIGSAGGAGGAGEGSCTSSGASSATGAATEPRVPSRLSADLVASLELAIKLATGKAANYDEGTDADGGSTVACGGLGDGEDNETASAAAAAEVHVRGPQLTKASAAAALDACRAVMVVYREGAPYYFKTYIRPLWRGLKGVLVCGAKGEPSGGLKSARNAAEGLCEGLVEACHDQNVRAIVAEQLNEAQFVFSTLAVCGRQEMRMMKKVEVLVVDEASQAVEAEILVGLLSRPDKCLLVGDPNQLSGTVVSQSARRAGFERSMMWRLMFEAGHPYDMLNTQYRMHPAISQFPNAQFYDSKLRDGVRAKDRTITVPVPSRFATFAPSSGAGAAAATLLLQPFSFFDVEGREERQGGGSLRNILEGKVVAAALVGLRKQCGVDVARRAVVITFYAAQKRSIQLELARTSMGDVQVHTVDSFQGSEADIVLLSFVRTSRESVGFLKDFRRLNVALTRAKCVCIGVGCAAALLNDRARRGKVNGKPAEHGHLGKLVEQAEKRGLLVRESTHPQFKRLVDEAKRGGTRG